MQGDQGTAKPAGSGSPLTASGPSPVGGSDRSARAADRPPQLVLAGLAGLPEALDHRVQPLPRIPIRADSSASSDTRPGSLSSRMPAGASTMHTQVSVSEAGNTSQRVWSPTPGEPLPSAETRLQPLQRGVRCADPGRAGRTGRAGRVRLRRDLRPLPSVDRRAGRDPRHRHRREPERARDRRALARDGRAPGPPRRGDRGDPRALRRRADQPPRRALPGRERAPLLAARRAAAAPRREDSIRELVDWALPIQERHLDQVREGSLQLAAAEDPYEE